MHPRRHLVVFVAISLMLLGIPYPALADSATVSQTTHHRSRSALAQQRLAASPTICPTELRFGLTIQCAIASPAERDSYTFTATQGDIVKVRIRLVTGALDPAIHLFNAQNKQLCAAFTSDTLAEIGSCTLQATGTYTLAVDDTYLTNTGDYLLYAQQLTHPDNAQALVFGRPLNDALDFPGEFKTYTLTVAAGSSVQLMMTRSSGTLNPRIRLYSPTGIQLCSAFSSNPIAEISTCTLASAGMYTVLVDDTFVNRTGSYSVRVACLNQACGLVQIYLPLQQAQAPQ
jgi:hypothetical protein